MLRQSYLLLPLSGMLHNSEQLRKFRNMIRIILIGCSFLLLSGCARNVQDEDSSPLFELLRQADTGLDFKNQLQQSTDFNVFSYMYFFNGGGVAAGDFNQDGKTDLYFTSNMGPNSLFLNEGDLKFREVTDLAGVAGLNGWTTGASVVDINNDGLLDIYVSQMGDYEGIKGHNQLYVCQGIQDGVPVFQDQAAYYGLDFVGFSTQASFVDYDLDGDLDMFLLNHSLHQNGTFGPRRTFDEIHPTSGDKLFRNDGGKFVDVTREAGILSTVIGYGLGIATSDINMDGWPDFYIGNDFHENDYLYINQQDGTFREVLTEQINHTSRFSMGVDIADINNDGYQDIVSLDMLPEDPYILKTSLGEDGYNIFQFKLGYGYNPQFARNNLQLNNRNGSFSEIGIYAGVSATDWSWAPLLFDFDNDGYKDLFISNGIPRRMNDIDYINFRMADENLKWKTDNNELDEDDMAVIDKMPRIKLANKFYHNRGDLTFTDLKDQIRNHAISFSNGSIYADLDNDGDLDVVTNNIDDEPFVYRNLSNENRQGPSNYLDLQFEGNPENLFGIGAKVIVETHAGRTVEEHFPVRGYQSSNAPGIHVSVQHPDSVLSLEVVWPDGTYQTINNPEWNSSMAVKWTTGLPAYDFSKLQEKDPAAYQFQDITAASGLLFEHQENPFVEFNREGLIPHMMSAEGPALAVGDVNGDGRDDVFLGNSKREKSALFFQRADGTFAERTPEAILNDSLFEDVQAVFADLENDGDLDLFVAAGGNEYRGKSEALMQRAYLNDGKGNFTRIDPFPGIHMTASCILPADFNGDGLTDFFIGGRAVTSSYGIVPESYLMLNKGAGVFEPVTRAYSSELAEVGLVKNGQWADLDADGDPDLILALEWQPLTIFRNEGDRFVKEELTDDSGWWNFVNVHDFDGDGDPDILAGNLGENSKLQPTPEEPVRMYVHDFDGNGQIEQILTYYLDGKEVPFANYAELTKQMVALKKKYLYAKDFASSSIRELFGSENLAQAKQYEINTRANMYFENTGGEFVPVPLPQRLQFAPLKASALADLDQDGRNEVILGGNFFENNIEMGFYDANFGNVLSFDSQGNMSVTDLGNLAIKGQVRNIARIQINGKEAYILAKNNGKTQILCMEREKPGNLVTSSD